MGNGTGPAGTGGPGSEGSADEGPGHRRRLGRALRMAFVLDVAGYGARTSPDRDAVQQRLRELVVIMLAACGLKLHQQIVDYQWSGDGINAILPSDIDPTFVLTVLIRSLTAALGRDNARYSDRIRLRMAVGLGLIERSAAGFGGPVIVDINRLVNSAALRSALADEPDADLAVAVTDQAHNLIIEPGYPGIPAGQFLPSAVVAKEFSGTAWVWVSTRQWSEQAYPPPGPADLREAGRYRVVARLGAAHGGHVYLASGGPQADPGWAAVKVFDRALAADPDARRRLTDGILAADPVRDPHLTSVIDSDIRDETVQPWVASTLVRGPSLAATVTETGPVPADTAGWIALGVARALAASHAAGLAHRAVSPRNVLLDIPGPVLTDLGTSRGALLGQPGSAADDVLMLGTTAFFAMTARPPWMDRPTPMGPTIPLPGSRSPDESDLPGCPPWLASTVLACLSADPGARPSAAEVHERLAAEAGPQPRAWLPEPVATRVRECQSLPPSRGRLRRPPWGRE